MTRLSASCLLVAVLVMPLSAGAQTDAAAEALFQEGVAKFDAGDFAAACPLLERAVASSSSEALGGMLTLAECYEKTSRPAKAWALYRKVGARARAAGQTPRAEEAERASTRLEPTLPRVRFVAPAGAPESLRVRFGDELVPSSVWSVALPVDPGVTRFTFEADGHRATLREVDVPASATVTEITAPALEPAAGSKEPTKVTPAEPPASQGGLGPLGIAGVVIGSIGGAAALASIGVAVDAKSKWDDAVTADCAADLERCRSLEGIDAARAQGDAGTVVFATGIGLVAIGTGLLIYDLVSSSSPTQGRAPSFGIAALPSQRGLDVHATARLLTW
jgi:hypothetical protein